MTLLGEENAGTAKDADALFREAVLHHRNGRLSEAENTYAEALTVCPGHPKASNNLGVLLCDLARPAEALIIWRQAIEIAPDDADLHSNLGIALQKLGRYEEALPCARRVLTLAPKDADAYFNLANVLQGLNHHDEAVAAYKQALNLSPGRADIYNNLGLSLVALNQSNSAIAAYQQACRAAPQEAEFYNNLGNAYRRLQLLHEAVSAYEHALAQEPNHANALSESMLCRLDMCDWDGLDDRVATIVDHVRRGGAAISPFCLLAVSDDPALQLACATHYHQSRQSVLTPSQPPAKIIHREKLRIGYYSNTFRTHAMSHLMVHLLERHNRNRFEICALSYGRDDGGPLRRRAETAVDEFLDLHQQSDDEVERKIAEQDIDILVDLNGWTERTRLRLMARRLAPVQAHFLGYPGTLGTDFIDYIFVDSFIAPEQQERYFAERIIRLPDSYQVNDQTRAIADHTPTRADCGLPDTGFVFCCFNQTYKITPPVFDIWMRLLSTVTGSVLWLLQSNEPAADNLRYEAMARNIDPKRLIFAPRMELADHLARHRLADLFLDTLPYNAHTTASDALWAELPVLTCAGDSMAARVAGSLLRAVGIPELITENHDEYEACAQALAAQPERLATIRSKLAINRNTEPLFDTDLFCRNMEAAYEKMWALHESGAPPSAFDVALD